MKHFKSNEEDKLNLFSSTMGMKPKECTQCVELENQLTQKENYIMHLRSYQTMLTDQMQKDQSESELEIQNRMLKKQQNESKILEKKLRLCIDELNEELKTKEFKLHQEGMLGQKLSQSNLDLKRSILNLEQDLLRSDLSSKYNSPMHSNNSTTLKKQQDVLEVVERDFQILKQIHQDLQQQSSQDLDVELSSSKLLSRRADVEVSLELAQKYNEGVHVSQTRTLPEESLNNLACKLSYFFPINHMALPNQQAQLYLKRIILNLECSQSPDFILKMDVKFNNLNQMQEDKAHEVREVLIPISRGFEEIETIAVVDILRRGGAKVTLACADPEKEELIVEGSNGLKVVCDSYLDDDLLKKSFDLIVLSGGSPNAETLGNCNKLVKRLKQQKNDGKWIGAICAAPAEVLEKNGLLEGEEATCYFKCSDKLKDQSKLNQKVVVSHNIITSQGPGTAIDFGLVLLEELYDKKTSEEVAHKLMASKPQTSSKSSEKQQLMYL